MSTSESVLSVVHLAATAAMVGLIWFVQIVHYPLFAAVAAEDFVAYENRHRTRTGVVVGPLMAVEGITAIWLAIDPPSGVSRVVTLAGLGLLGVIHASTVLLQVPAHVQLSERHDPAVIGRLVRTNWIRTVGWTARGVLAAVVLVAAVG